MKISYGVPLSSITSFHIGGPAACVITLEHESECRGVFDAHNHALILGGGTNVLAPDLGVSQAVVTVGMQRIQASREGTHLHISAMGGASWDAVVATAVAREAWGIENLSYIPGTVGGAAVQNIGAYGSVLSDSVVSVRVWDRVRNAFRTLSRSECGFGYRTSIMKQHPNRFVVVEVALMLAAQGPQLSYPDLARRFHSMAPSIAEVRAAIGEIRATKFPSLATHGCAGSFFMNPVATNAEVEALRIRYPGMPTFELPEGGTKIPLAWLLDHAIGAKGMRVGSAFVWDAQPLVIAVERGATAREVRELAEKISSRVFETTHIKIFPEVVLL